MPNKAADPMHNVNTRMGNVNMSDDPRKEHELDTLTASPGEDKDDADVEDVLGSVHISKPSIKRVFFLLRPFLRPALEAFNRVEHELHELVNAMKLERMFIDTPVLLSTNIGYQVNYQDRKFLYIMTMNPNLPQLVVNGNTLAGMQPARWFPLEFNRGTVVTCTAADATPIPFIVRACDHPLAMYNISLPGSTIALATGSNVIGSTNSISDYPVGAVPVNNSSGNQANAVAAATLPAVAAKTTYLTGFEVTGTGATGVLIVTITVTGSALIASYTYVFVAGATTPNQPVAFEFTKPIPAGAVNTTIVVSCPASGAGGTNNVVNAHGYQL
jgi:hypothetical protein